MRGEVEHLRGLLDQAEERAEYLESQWEGLHTVSLDFRLTQEGRQAVPLRTERFRPRAVSS